MATQDVYRHIQLQQKRTGNTDSFIYIYLRGIFDEKRLDEKF